MKLSRHKFVRRLLNYYRTHFQFELPFVILIDGTFAFEALQWKIQIDEQLKSYLETDQILCSTTLCAIRETELLGTCAEDHAVRCPIVFPWLRLPDLVEKDECCRDDVGRERETRISWARTR